MKKEILTTKSWAILNLVVFFLTLAINYLGSSGFFNGMGQAEVSGKYTTLVTPAGFAFSIWGVIYTLLLITLMYFLVKSNDKKVSKLVQMISPLFILSSLLNMGWIISFSYEMVGISTLLILGMVISLLLIVERIYKNSAELPSTLAGISFTLYGAWVFIASILNSAIFLVKQNWDGFGISDSIWTIVILFVAIGFVMFYLSLYNNAVFPISLAWAFFGIYSSYSSGRLTSDMAPIIQGVLIFGIAVFILSIIVTFVKNEYSIFPRETR